MTIEHYVLWGVVRHGQQMPARSSYSSGIFLCVYICNVYLVHAMGGHIVQDLEELP